MEPHDDEEVAKAVQESPHHHQPEPIGLNDALQQPGMCGGSTIVNTAVTVVGSYQDNNNCCACILPHGVHGVMLYDNNNGMSNDATISAPDQPS
jgi:hypothetical protein